jgi:hypothetical protein
MAGYFSATAAGVLLTHPPQIPQTRNNSGAQQNEHENKRPGILKVRFHAPDMPASEAAADLPPVTPDFQHRKDGMEKEWNADYKIHQKQLGIRHRTPLTQN